MGIGVVCTQDPIWIPYS